MGCQYTKIIKTYDYPVDAECIICFEQTYRFHKNKLKQTYKAKCCNKIFCNRCWTQSVEIKKIIKPKYALCPNCRFPYHKDAVENRREELIADIIEQNAYNQYSEMQISEQSNPILGE